MASIEVTLAAVVSAVPGGEIVEMLISIPLMCWRDAISQIMHSRGGGSRGGVLGEILAAYKGGRSESGGASGMIGVPERARRESAKVRTCLRLSGSSVEQHPGHTGFEPSWKFEKSSIAFRKHGMQQ